MPEKNLQTLISTMNPELHSDEYVFCSLNEQDFNSLAIKPLCIFQEDEGVSLIVEKTIANKASLQYKGSWALITCKINSDLTAVGFLAAMSKVLAEANISVNAVSAYHHDYLFVPAERAKDAMKLLEELSNSTLLHEQENCLS